MISVVLQVSQWYVVLSFSVSFKAYLQAKWWRLLFSTWVQKSVPELNTQMWCPRGIWHLKQTPLSGVSPLWCCIEKASCREWHTLQSTTRSSQYSLIPLSFTSSSDRPTSLKLVRWYSCKMSKCAKKAESCTGVNALNVPSYCAVAFHERAGERGENHVSQYLKCCTRRSEDCSEGNKG